jgi:aerobic carbon-monoxide dehydrogenase small subunit
MDVRLNVDGHEHQIDVEARMTLADALREHCGVTAVHLGCEQGSCGACTVVLDGEAVRSCLVFAVQADRSRVTTAAGLADGDRPHPVQQALAEHHGLQCGFCTPGFAVLLAHALDERPDLDDDELLDLVSSNLCRCTGYRGILAAARSVRDQRAGLSGGGAAAARPAPR